MKLADIPQGTTCFIDANILLYALTNHPTYGTGCAEFLKRVENQEILATTSTHVLGEVVHRLMTIEACDRFGWPQQGIANRLRRHPQEVKQLLSARKKLNDLQAARVNFHVVDPASVFTASDLTQQTGLLFGDALIVAMMQDQGITQLASLDADFDRIPGVTRFAPA
jgi:predicted nucleic acid-binding protein